MSWLEYAVSEPSETDEILAPIFLGLIFGISFRQDDSNINPRFPLWLFFAFNLLWRLCELLPFAFVALPAELTSLDESIFYLFGAIGIMLSLLMWIPVTAKPRHLFLRYASAFAVYSIGIIVLSRRRDVVWAHQPEDIPRLQPGEMLLFSSRWGLISLILAVIPIFLIHLIKSTLIYTAIQSYRYLLHYVLPLQPVRFILSPFMRILNKMSKPMKRFKLAIIVAWSLLPRRVGDPTRPRQPPVFENPFYAYPESIRRNNAYFRLRRFRGRPELYSQHPYDTFAWFAPVPWKRGEHCRPWPGFEPPKEEIKPEIPTAPPPLPPPSAPVVPREPLSTKLRRLAQIINAFAWKLIHKVKPPPDPRIKRKKTA